MVISGQREGPVPIRVNFSPKSDRSGLPVEILDRAELLQRIKGRELASRQQASFHQLIVCTGGSGAHQVDYETIEMSPGTLLRIYPGQVQQFVTTPRFDAHMMVWPVDSHPVDPAGHSWFPGSGTARWQCDRDLEIKVNGWIDDLRQEQMLFDGSPRRVELMSSLLRSMLLRLAITQSTPENESDRWPTPYLEFRELIEDELRNRPTVATLARSLGYSTRTLDRACHKATGQTAKRVLDERVTLEVRRALTHTDLPIARIRTDFGFSDQSNFSKFVKRHLGLTPGEVRDYPH